MPQTKWATRTPLTKTPLPDAPNGTIPQFQQYHAMLQGGQPPAEAGAELGVDPLLARLWAALPANHFSPVVDTAPTPVPALGPPRYGLSRVLLVHVPRGIAVDAGTVQTALAEVPTEAALANAIAACRGWFVGATWAYTLPGAVVAALADAAAWSNIDTSLLAGQLLADRLSVATIVYPRPIAPLPAPKEPLLRRAQTIRQKRAPLSPPAAAADESAPTGTELAARRHEVGVSQRDLAAASGLSRGLVAEIERGKRRHVGTRLKMAETLAQLTRDPGPRSPTRWDTRLLTPAQVVAIRRAAAGGTKLTALANEHQVSINVIWQVVHRQSYQDVPNELIGETSTC